MGTTDQPIIFGKRKAVIVGASWDSQSQRAHIVYTDEKGKEHTTRALGMSKYELRQAVLAELMNTAWPEDRWQVPNDAPSTSPTEA